MKVYPNDLCLCGSGKKYKQCCMNKSVHSIGAAGSLPIDGEDSNLEFFVNRKGAVVFRDEAKQPVLDIPEGSITKQVLSVGLHNNRHPMATIQEQDGPICYILPDWYIEWCQTCIGIAMEGTNFFPADVIFSNIHGQYSADIL